MVWIGMPKILILDDDTTFLNAVTAALMAERTDIAIDTALCAEAGLLLIGTIHYDAIISDYRMSGLDGLRLVKDCADHGLWRSGDATRGVTFRRLCLSS
jgi:DNA-binding NtrC family response regulator